MPSPTTAGDKVPIILLTAKDEVSDRVVGANAGADYIVKPVMWVL